MTDIFSPSERSNIMRLVKSSQNKSTELRLILYFRLLKISGWRRNYKLLGHPDFVFPSKKVAVFTDGCFWHGHNCRNLKPRDNSKYWLDKIRTTMKRDKMISSSLQEMKWKVLRIWECELKNADLVREKLSILLNSE